MLYIKTQDAVDLNSLSSAWIEESGTAEEAVKLSFESAYKDATFSEQGAILAENRSEMIEIIKSRPGLQRIGVIMSLTKTAEDEAREIYYHL